MNVVEQLSQAVIAKRAWSIAQAARESVESDGPAAYPMRAFQQLAEADLLAAPLPSRIGGLGLGSEPDTTETLLDVLAIIGWGDLSLARLYEGHLNALLLLQLYGTAEQIKAASRDVARGFVFGVWNTESTGGLCLLEAGSGAFFLEGAKTFASGAGYIERPLVTARDTQGGWRMVLLEMEHAHAQIVPDSWWTFGMRASHRHRIELSGTPIEPTQLNGNS